MMNIETFLNALVSSILERRWWARGAEEIIGPGGPIFGPQPEPWRERLGQPIPWRVGPGVPWRASPRPEPWHMAVSQLVEGAQMKDVAARLPEGQQRSALGKAAAASIEGAIDDLCPPPRKIPWPRPHWGFEIVSGLAQIADTFSPGLVRDEILNAAAQVAAKTLEVSDKR
jgi:hypothetical protein